MRRDRLTIALSILVAIAATRLFRGREGIDRAAARPALVAALTFAGVLSLGAGMRLAGVTDERPVLWTYDLAIAGLATLLFVDLLRARWPQAVLRGLVLDLQGSISLRARLAKALGDPSLVVGVWDAERHDYRDEAGAPVVFPREGQGRAAIRVDDDGVPLALLTHDEAAIGASELLPAVAAVARTAVANASLERRIEDSAREIAASRRRLVEAADDERRALQQTLEQGPGRRLRHVSALLAEAGVELQGDVESAIAELRELANGVRPPELEHGLRVALPVLAERCSLDVLVTAQAGRLPEAVEAAAYFVCSEALANAAKHSGARSARVEATVMSDRLRVAIRDDGVGAADVDGPGLRGLADRVEALGGSLRVTSPPTAGTEVLAEIPCNAQ
jgi:signal transduction histidine kinase